MKEKILNRVADLVSDLCYYGRKEDSECDVEQFEEALQNKEVSIQEIVAHFEKELQRCYPHLD